jgi:hypothetical protein
VPRTLGTNLAREASSRGPIRPVPRPAARPRQAPRTSRVTRRGRGRDLDVRFVSPAPDLVALDKPGDL